MAMPHMADPNFAKSVVLICEHASEGAMGIIVNRPMPHTMAEIFAGQKIEGGECNCSLVHNGGPVQPQIGFLIYTSPKIYKNSLPVTGTMRLGTTIEILRDIADGGGPEKFLFAVGYAGWGPGQLDGEILRNDWLVVPACEEIVYALPYEERWKAAISKLGIHPAMLAEAVGNA